MKMNKQNLVRGLNTAGWVSLITLFLIGISGTTIPGWLFLLPPVFFIPALIIAIISLNELIKAERKQRFWDDMMSDYYLRKSMEGFDIKDPRAYEEKRVKDEPISEDKAEAYFVLSLESCLKCDSELTAEQAETFAMAYGKELFDVARCKVKIELDEEDYKELIRKEMER